ncbi:MAG: DUF1109 domain-containing protein [Alphaproteobacteria bacterium]|nr:DUF1109 domain-containing protein [Alphaproteobacteria bacterium]
MNTQNLIEQLSADLRPVTPIRPFSGVALVLITALLVALCTLVIFGGRADLMAGTPNPIVVIRGSLLVLLGLATSIAAARAARPTHGAGQNGWMWALAAALVMPLVAAMLFCYHLLTATPFKHGDMDFGYYAHCFGISVTGALLIGAGLTLWLRRGAPVNSVRAGWLVGLASGSFGTFAYSLNCPSNSIYYIGLIYSLAVGVCAVTGRLIVPRIIRW